ncbi:FecR family protein [Roseivirga sp.]|uniref:FecR family protein n=1 Tax=Roseivirga sp. TaxID=1964215 RepID=UPI003B8E5368
MKEDNIIKQWLQEEKTADNFQQLEKAIALSQNLEVPSNKSHEDAWADLLNNINTKTTDNEHLFVPQSKNYKQFFYYAASIVAIIFIGYFGLQNTPEPTVYSTGLAVTETQFLPDNSEITINASSSISLMEEKWAEERTLSLSGEAFFDVIPGSKFTVLTELGDISVLGTSFNVFVREDILKVSTFSGKVRVESGENSTILLKGDELVFDSNKDEWNVKRFSENQTATWRSGSFHFESTPLDKVIEALERQFAIEIEVDRDVDQNIYSGYFSKTDLKEALQLVFTPMGMQFKIDGNKVNVY